MGDAAVDKVVVATESGEVNALEEVKHLNVAVAGDKEDQGGGGGGGGQLHGFLHRVYHLSIVHHHVLPCARVPQAQLVVGSKGHQVKAIWGELEAVHHAVVCHFS